MNLFKPTALGIFTKKKKTVLEKKLFLDALNNNNLSGTEDKQWLLHLACRYDREDVVGSLLADTSVDANGFDKDGKVAIIIATESGSIDCFNCLLRYGVNLNQIDKNGRSVLIAAITVNNFNMVDKLIKRGNLTRDIISQAVQYVISLRNSEALAILADYDEVDLTELDNSVSFLDKKQYSALHYAAKRGFVAAIKKLIHAGCHLNFRNVKTRPVNLSYMYNQYKALSVLLSLGCAHDVDMKFMGVNKWIVIVKRHDSELYESMKGADIQELLQCLKLFQGSNSGTCSSKIHIICYKILQQLDLLDFFPLQVIESVTFVRCRLARIPIFTNLKSLCLISCQVADYTNMAKFCNLQALRLCKNGLTVLPDSVKDLRELKFLDVSFNNIAALPSWVMKLPLEFLNVSNNNLMELAELLPKQLRTLLIHNNAITRLSPLLSTLPKLSFISLSKNPLVFPEVSITKNTTKSLLQYLHAFLTDTVANQSVKLSLVGQEGVGKSTLAAALTSGNGICENLSSIVKTDGLEITDLNLDGINLRVFDLAGDIDFIETHNMFISEGTVYLAVFDLRTYAVGSHSDFLGRVEVWLASIYAQAPHSRVIFVGTNADAEMMTAALLDCIWEHISTMLRKVSEQHRLDFSSNPCNRCLLCNSDYVPERRSTDGVAGYVSIDDPTVHSGNIVKEEEKEISCDAYIKFPHLVGYYEVSNTCQIPKVIFGGKNLSILQLKEGIRQSCVDLLTLKPTIPRKWVNLCDVLTKQVQNCFPMIQYETFTDLAFKCGFEYSVEELAPFLLHYHSCGELLFYHSNEMLCDVIITDPQWLSNQLRTVISYRTTHNLNDGVITHAQLSVAWSHLSSDSHDKLLALFRQAGVFLPFNDDSELIPCQLPIGRPSEDVWPRFPKENENQMDYFFSFDNLPPSFFSQLVSLVESKRFDTGMMQPLYLSNHIVYFTKSTGIPCDLHTKGSMNLTRCIHSPANSREMDMLTEGVNLALYMSLEPSSVQSLLDVGRNSFQISSRDGDDNNAVDIDFNFDVHKITCRHRVHFELLPHKKAILLSIRGSRPCCLSPETIDMLNRLLLTLYEGTNTRFFVLCPVCVRKGYHDPVKFTLLDMETYEPVCSKGHDLVSWDAVMTGRCDFIPVLTSESLIANMTENECPKLFVMAPVNLHGVGLKEFYTLTYLRDGFAVHLLCEFPDCWHFLPSPGYRLTRPKDFVKKYGRRLQSILKVIGAFEKPARVAGMFFEPASDFADCCEKINEFVMSLEEHLRDFQEEWSFSTGISISDEMKYLKSSDGLKRREFRRFLNKADEENRFGDLIPTFYGDTILWLCEKHHKMQSTT